MTLESINARDLASFISAIGWIFEHSPWVAERAWSSRPFASIDALHRAMVEQVERAQPDEQLALLRAHPDLGTRAKVSHASAAEQAGAGLDQLTSEEFECFQRLNAAYRDKFGFPFLFAVKGSGKKEILASLERRVQLSPEPEFRVALEQVYRIARFRLDDMVN